MFFNKDLKRYDREGFKWFLQTIFIFGFRFIFLFWLHKKAPFLLKPILYGYPIIINEDTKSTKNYLNNKI